MADGPEVFADSTPDAFRANRYGDEHRYLRPRAAGTRPVARGGLARRPDGAADILYKPVGRDALERAITKVISGRALSPPVPGTS